MKKPSFNSLCQNTLDYFIMVYKSKFWSIRKHFEIYLAITISDICLRQKNNEQFDRYFIEAVVMIYNTQD